MGAFNKMLQRCQRILFSQKEQKKILEFAMNASIISILLQNACDYLNWLGIMRKWKYCWIQSILGLCTVCIPSSGSSATKTGRFLYEFILTIVTESIGLAIKKSSYTYKNGSGGWLDSWLTDFPNCFFFFFQRENRHRDCFQIQAILAILSFQDNRLLPTKTLFVFIFFPELCRIRKVWQA